jgi:hypothetical protein
MRGPDAMQESLFTVAKLDDFVPADHPLRSIRVLVNDALAAMNTRFNEIYADSGRDSIPPEKLIRALLLQVFYDLPSVFRAPTSGTHAASFGSGHWEGDLLSGSNNTHIATLVERHSRFTMLVKLQGKGTARVVTASSKQVRKLPSELRRSLTWDRGMEMAEHKRFTIATDVKTVVTRI